MQSNEVLITAISAPSKNQYNTALCETILLKNMALATQHHVSTNTCSVKSCYVCCGCGYSHSAAVSSWSGVSRSIH